MIRRGAGARVRAMAAVVHSAGARAGPGSSARPSPAGAVGAVVPWEGIVSTVAPDEVQVAMICDLLGAALASGCSVPRALRATGAAVGGERGAELERAGALLVLGASWAEAWDGGCRDLVPVMDALRAAWERGDPPGAALVSAAEAVRRTAEARAVEAAARLGVRLVLPLGLCHLPAFVLLGIVPVVLAVAAGSLG